MNRNEVKRVKRAAWMKARRANLEALGIDPPAAFHGDKPKPLAIGAGDEFVAQVSEEAKAKVRIFLCRYTQSEWYLWQCVKPGSMRHRLDGEPVEPVSDSHRAHAETLAVKRQAQRTVKRLIKDGVLDQRSAPKVTP